MGRRHRQHPHHRRRDERGAQQQAIGIQPRAKLGHDQRATDGAQSHRTQQNAVEPSPAVQQLARHQRQQGPHRTGQRKENKGAQQHHVQLAAGAGIAQTGTKRPREALAERVFFRLRATPPDQRSHHKHITDHVHAIGIGRAHTG
ncbi:hypothetical protein SDC9_199558 [bioreactor metagenome]|uniref:Uncharacterized protein n=1 Tax=bioreactor metagenome TaxID=1076179 RepID=A0A645IKW2_9ZZZZ